MNISGKLRLIVLAGMDSLMTVHVPFGEDGGYLVAWSHEGGLSLVLQCHRHRRLVNYRGMLGLSLACGSRCCHAHASMSLV